MRRELVSYMNLDDALKEHHDIIYHQRMFLSMVQTRQKPLRHTGKMQQCRYTDTSSSASFPRKTFSLRGRSSAKGSRDGRMCRSSSESWNRIFFVCTGGLWLEPTGISRTAPSLSAIPSSGASTKLQSGTVSSTTRYSPCSTPFSSRRSLPIPSHAGKAKGHTKQWTPWIGCSGA